MSETQSPDSASKPKRRTGFSILKDRANTAEARVKELEAKLAASTGRAVGGTPGYDRTKDPCGFLADLDEIWLVSRVYAWPARKAVDDRRGKQEPTSQIAESRRAWGSCPFKLSHPEPRENANLQYYNKLWWKHCITREFAEETYAGFGPVLPETAVVLPENFEGVRPGNRIKGRKTPASGDPLVEYVRWSLQIESRRTFFDTDHAEVVTNGWVDRIKPNPYGSGVAAQVPINTRVVTE